MRSSFCQSNKSLLFVGVALALLVQTTTNVYAQTPAAPDEWYQNATWVMNEFTPDVDEYLIRVGIYTHADQPDLNYQIGVFDLLDGGSLSDPIWVTSSPGTVSGVGYHEVVIPQQLVHASDSYYIALNLSGAPVGTDVYYGLYYTDETAYYTTETFDVNAGGGNWVQYNDTSWGIFAITSPTGSVDDGIQVVATAGDWSYENELNSPTDTLTVDVTAANSDGPYDMEIEVNGSMDPITVGGTLLNDTGHDWAGFAMQLGHGLGEDFVLATDGLSFVGNPLIGLAEGSTEFVYGLPIDDEELLEDLAFGINRPGDDPYTFTLRMMAIPEPASVLLLTIAGLLLVLRRKR